MLPKNRPSWGGLISLIGLVLFIGLACNLPFSIVTPTSITPKDTITPQIPPTGETPIAIITPDSQVRRLIPNVFAGNVLPLPELTNNIAQPLAPGGMVTTDANGEAEILIQGCLKIFLFQDVTLERSTCRKSDAASGLGVCSSSGLTGVLNQCLSKVDVQTPSSSASTNGTWYSVIYLPEDQLSIIQVYEGTVDVNAVINQRTESITDGQKIEAGNLWFTAPGREAPNINGIEGRQSQPLEVWQAMRPALIDKYPNLNEWMESAKEKANKEDLVFPDFLVLPRGDITIQLIGERWENRNATEAVLFGIPWSIISTSLWSDLNMVPSIDINQSEPFPASELTHDTEQALNLLYDTEFPPLNTTIFIVSPTNNPFSENYANELQLYLLKLDLSSEIIFMSEGEYPAYQKEMMQQDDMPFIFLNADPSFYSGFPNYIE